MNGQLNQDFANEDALYKNYTDMGQEGSVPVLPGCQKFVSPVVSAYSKLPTFLPIKRYGN